MDERDRRLQEIRDRARFSYQASIMVALPGAFKQALSSLVVDDIPWLLAEIERLDEEVEDMEEELNVHLDEIDRLDK